MPRSREELKEYFEKVQNPNDWKAPINALVDPADVDGVTEAVIFYTGTIPEYKRSGKQVRVTAVGYRMGPCGDH